MAISYDGVQSGWTDKSAGTTFNTNTCAAAVGKLVIARGYSDNGATASGPSSTHTVTDGKANTWVKLGEYTVSAGVAGDGCTISLWYTIVTVAILAATNYTLTVSSSCGARGLWVTKFTTAGIVGNVLASGASGSSTTPSVTVSGLRSGAYQWIGAVCIEGPSGDAFTQDADFTHITSDGCSGGADDTNIVGYSAWRATTVTGSETYNPVLGTSRDWAALLGAIYEVVPPTGALLPLNQPYQNTLLRM